MFCEKISNENRYEVNEFIMKQWYSTTMVLRGKEIDMTQVEGFFFKENDQIIALITYIVYGDILEITSLDSLKGKCGLGSQLVESVIEKAKESNCQKVVLITTNDNLNAMKFYQKRGFDMVRLFHNAMDEARKYKPQIPLIGENGIPLCHEIEFERIL